MQHQLEAFNVTIVYAGAANRQIDFDLQGLSLLHDGNTLGVEVRAGIYPVPRSLTSMAAALWTIYSNTGLLWRRSIPSSQALLQDHRVSR